VLCAAGFGIAVLELIAAVTIPRTGDIISGPGFSMLFFPFTILGIVLSHSSQRDLRKRGQARSGLGIAALWMGYLVLPLIILSFNVAVANPAGRKIYSESFAISGLRTINAAEITYEDAHSGGAGTIRQLIDEGLLDQRFEGSVSGYTFVVTVSGSEYTATSTPTQPNAGRYAYYSNPEAVIRYATQASGTCSPCYPEGLSGQPVN
jgi:hypothetical protein